MCIRDSVGSEMCIRDSCQDDFDTKALNAWMREQMPAYKTPRAYYRLPELPRNAMGKVTKKDVVNLIKN
jgi:malonyl-CoA/methylmalonyl-CoA synthetase